MKAKKIEKRVRMLIDTRYIGTMAYNLEKKCNFESISNTKTLMRRILLIDPLKNGFPIAKTHLLFMATLLSHF